MLDVDQALQYPDGPESNKIKQLSSRLAVEEALARRPDISQVHQRCVSELNAWDQKRDDTREPTVAGWMNLFAELLLSGDAGNNPADNVQVEGPKAGLPSELPSLLTLLVLARRSDGGEALRTAIAGSAHSWADWPKRAMGWHDLLLPRGDKEREDYGTEEDGQTKKPKLAKTDLGQTLILHLLEAILGPYEKCEEVRSRGQLNVLLVPLLRAVFTYPDRAHAAYERYSYGYASDGAVDAFRRLYGHDLVILEEFQDYSISKRPKTLAGVRDAALMTEHIHGTDELPPLPDVLLDRANKILHGVEKLKDPATSPRPKRIPISQLTLLIRRSAPSEYSQARAFSSHLEGTHYRRMEFVRDIRPDFKFDWTSRDNQQQQEFINCVREYYRAGYKLHLLRRLFRADDPNSKAAGSRPFASTDPYAASSFPPTWIQDGEVTFLWLLSAWAQVLAHNGNLGEWVIASLDHAPSFPHHIIVGGQSGSTRGSAHEYVGESLQAFSTRRACLFDSEGKPLPKAWAFVNFLERAVVYRRIREYAASDGKRDAGAEGATQPPSTLAVIACELYEELSNGNLSLDLFKQACLTAIKKFEISKPEDVAALSPFPSFFLELVLRNQDPVPYSLFFYPIAFDADGLPSAFLAGTFAGLEWSSYPSVTERQNCHLFVLLDGLRPIVDFEVGRVLALDQRNLAKTDREMAEARERQEAAEQREKTAREIIPAVERLSKLFEDAQGRVFEIQAAIDPDWGGLFTGALDKAIEKCFSDGEVRIESNHRQKADKGTEWGRDPERDSFHASHREQPSGSAILLYDRLIYIVRDKFHYDKTPLIPQENVFQALCRERPSTPKDLRASTPGEVLDAFRNNKFFAALFLALNTENAANLSILLRLLTQGTTEASRGLHVAQLAAALGMTAANTKDETRDGSRETEPRIYGLGNNTVLKGRSFNPRSKHGLYDLAGIIEAERGGQDSRRIISSPGDLTWRVTLAAGIPPFRFLRALHFLGGEALSPDSREHDRVRFSDWTLTWRTGTSTTPGADARGGASAGAPNQLLVDLNCDNHFKSAAKAALWGYIEQGEQGYHNLRSNFRDLCDAVGSPPTFTKDDDTQPTTESPFIIVEIDGESPRTHFRFLLGCSPIKQRRDASSQRGG